MTEKLPTPKTQLHQLIKNLMAYIVKISAENPNETLNYDAALVILKKLDNSMHTNLSDKERKDLLKSSSAFNAKEFRLSDKSGASQKLSEINSKYEKIYKLNDPDIDNILKGL